MKIQLYTGYDLLALSLILMSAGMTPVQASDVLVRNFESKASIVLQRPSLRPVQRQQISLALEDVRTKCRNAKTAAEKQACSAALISGDRFIDELNTSLDKQQQRIQKSLSDTMAALEQAPTVRDDAPEPGAAAAAQPPSPQAGWKRGKLQPTPRAQSNLKPLLGKQRAHAITGAPPKDKQDENK